MLSCQFSLKCPSQYFGGLGFKKVDTAISMDKLIYPKLWRWTQGDPYQPQRRTVADVAGPTRARKHGRATASDASAQASIRWRLPKMGIWSGKIEVQLQLI